MDKMQYPFLSREWKISAGLALLALTMFLPAIRFGFIRFDDGVYVSAFRHFTEASRLQPGREEYREAAIWACQHLAEPRSNHKPPPHN